MERRDLYGFNAYSMTDESLADYVERLEEDKDRIDTFLSIAWEEIRRRSET